MDSWFRPVFARRQTSTQSTDSTSFSTDDSHMKEEAVSKNKATSRTTSRMGFLLGSPSILTPAAISSTPSPAVIQPPESLYHKPSPDQMVETLKVVMMNQSSLDPVPVQYNSCILHDLEAYHDLQLQLRQKDEEVELLKKSHARDIDDFDEMAKRWSTKESDYQKEVKRLEVLLANTEGGMEAVAIARSHSLVHGSKRASDSITRGIGTAKERNEHDSQQDRSAAPFTTRRSEVSHRIHLNPSVQFSGKRVPVAATSLLTSVGVSDKTSVTTSSSSSSSAKTQPGEDTPKMHTSENWSLVPGWARASLGQRNIEQGRRGKQEHCGSRDAPSCLQTDLRYASIMELTAPNNTLQGHRIALQDKPLPSIPNGAADRARPVAPKASPLTESDTYSGSSPPYLPVPAEMGFSFQPGDDASILSPTLAGDEFDSQTYDKSLGQTNSNGPTWATSPIRSHPAHSFENRSKKQSATKMKSSTAVKSSHIPKEFHDSYETLSREDSTSSVVTAVRDNSGKKSVNSKQNSKLTGRPRLDRGISSTISDAVATAAKALAKGSGNSPGESVIASGSREESDIETEAQGSKKIPTSGTSSLSRKQAIHQELRAKGL